MSDFIPYGRQSIDEDDIKAVVEVMRSDFITQGSKIREFESALAAYCNARFAIVFSSGTSALHAAYFSAGIGLGDEIITSPITFVATANAAIYLGARPVFVDVEPDTGNINPELIEQAITKKTKTIIPVHYAGHPVDLDPIYEIAKKHGLIVIEDACHALGASYKNQTIGSLSDMTVFSFHPVKHITTGEGGAVTTESREFYERLIMFRDHGITRDKGKFRFEPHGDWYYEMQFLGYNYRLTDIQCALGISQLKKLNSFIHRRRELLKMYENEFKGNPYFDLPFEKPFARSSWHLYPIRFKNEYVEKKPMIFKKLRERHLGVQVHYIPVYLQPYYKEISNLQGVYPEAELFYKRQLSLPIYFGMKDKDAKQVIELVFRTIENQGM